MALILLLIGVIAMIYYSMFVLGIIGAVIFFLIRIIVVMFRKRTLKIENKYEIFQQEMRCRLKLNVKSSTKIQCKQYVSRRLMKILIIIVMLLSPLGGVWFAMLMQRKEGSIKESYWRVMMIISGCWAIYVVTFQFFQRHYIFLGINMFFLICVIELYCKRHKPLKKFKR